MSPRRIPIVINGHLVTNTSEPLAIEVGSKAWFAWLCAGKPSSFSYQTPHGAITIRPEKKRQGWYWYAYHAANGSLRKSYLGKADAITPERLRLAAVALTRQPGAQNADDLSPGVQMTFLAAPHLMRNGQAVTMTSMKAIGLLAYLGAHDRPQRREHLMALLWPESPIQQARKNLRNLLWSIRDLLGPDVLTGHETLTLGSHVHLDLVLFAQAQRDAQRKEASRQDALECYQTMIALYQGSFLDGIALNDAAEFETWVAMTREQYHEAHAHALRVLATNHRDEGRWAEVITLARTAVMQDILQEPMYRMLMEAHARMGDRASALRQYETLRATLERELGVPPLAETEQLRRDILDGRLQPALLADAAAASLPGRAVLDEQRTAPFIGRAGEIAALDGHWAVAQQGQALVALISGEVGQGKSRLWQMWSSRLDPAMPVLMAHCLSTTQGVPFAPLADMLRSPIMRRRLLRLAQPVAPVWLEDIMQLVPDLRDELPAPPPTPIFAPLEEQGRLFEALVQSLGIRADHPLVLFFDNLHWADQATIEWLGYLLHRGHDLPFLLVGAYRPEEAQPALTGLITSWMREGVAHRLPLARLNYAETTRLIAALNGDAGRAEELYGRSAGNPYFLIELLRAEPGAMPARLTDLITLRLDQLPGAARQVLQVAALLQPEIDCTLLQHISGRTEEETIEAVETLLQTRLLRDGRQVRFINTADAANQGIAVVSQELNLFPDLDVLSNLFLLREPRRGPFIARGQMLERAEPVMQELGLRVNPRALVSSLSLEQRQLLEIARALMINPRVLILDEPTSALHIHQTERLHNVLRTLRQRDVAVVYVSHILEDVLNLCDEVTVLRDGERVLDAIPARQLGLDEIVQAMLGEKKPRQAHQHQQTTHKRYSPTRDALRFENVTVPGRLESISFEATAGSVVGVAGLADSGHRDVLAVAAGLLHPSSGRVTLPHDTVARPHRRAAVQQGVALVPGDRRRVGLMLDAPLWENMAQVRSVALARDGGIIRPGVLRRRAQQRLAQLSIQAASVSQETGRLSGGNQQKVVFAKWLEANPSVLLLDDPTRGIDIGAKAEIYALMRDLARQGVVQVLASTDLAELATVCDEVLVFFGGHICAHLSGQALNAHAILEVMNTGKPL
ncbi:MAG: ATP-binding cassette domain-containing protein [Nitrososphaerota archaeon]